MRLVRSKKFLFFFVALNLIPVLAVGQAVANRARTPSDVGFDEAKKLFTNFEVAIEGGHAKLFGRLPSACKDLVEFKTVTDGQTVGWVIVDRGGLRECAEGKTCSGAADCTSIPQLANTSIDLTQFDNTSAKIAVTVFEKNIDRNRFEPKVVAEYETRAFKEEHAQRTQTEEDEKKRAKVREALTKMCTDCANDEDELNKLEEQLNEALAIGVLTDAEHTNQLRAVQDRRFQLLAYRAESCSLEKEEERELRDELTDWAKNNCKQADHAALALHSLARCRVNSPTADLASYKVAEEILKDARRLKCVSKESKKNIDNILTTEMPCKKAEFVASQGLENNMVFGPYYQGCVNQLQKNVTNACYSRTRDLEACAAAASAFKAATDPQKGYVAQARMADMRALQFECQIASTLGSFNPRCAALTNNNQPNSSQVPGPAGTAAPVFPSSSSGPMLFQPTTSSLYSTPSLSSQGFAAGTFGASPAGAPQFSPSVLGVGTFGNNASYL